MIVKNNVYGKIVEERFIMNEEGNETPLEDLTMKDIDIRKKDGDFIDTEKIYYFVTNPFTNLGYVICAYNKEDDTITPLVYGNEHQEITYAEGIEQRSCKGDMIDELRIKHEGNTIRFRRDYLWFLWMHLMEDNGGI